MSRVTFFKISEAAYRCNVATEDIVQFISHEWVQPHDFENLLLDEDDIARILLIVDLRNQMGVNDEGVPIILHLIDQLNHLHLELLPEDE